MRYLLTTFLALFLLTFINSCQKEVSVEIGLPAKGSLQGDGGDCLPKTVSGTYIAGKALTDSNFMEVTVDVLTPGPYTIATDTLNGYSFKATGTFAAAGTSMIRLKGSGKPVISGANNFTVVFDSSYCEIAISVLPAGGTAGPATFTLATSGTACTPFDLQGSYIKDTTLILANKVGVQVNVSATGTYTITTNTLNGYSFSNTGTFSTTGVQTVYLQGAGKPVAAQTDNFTVTAGSLTCSFPVTVLAAAPSPCGITPQGTYTAGTVLAASNKIVLTHTYTTAGNKTISIASVNGYSFGPAAYTATAGSNTITLTGTGTPVAAGTNAFIVNFGDGSSCTFTVTVAPGVPPVANTDYFPTTPNSWWSYNDDTGVADTFKVTNAGPTMVFGSNTYQRFVYDNAGVTYSEEFYRKDPTGAYYRSEDTVGYGSQGLTFSQPRIDILFLKNTLTTGDSLVTNANAVFNTGVTGTFTGIFRIKFKVISTTASLMVNGKNFTNLYQLRLTYEFGVAGTFIDITADPADYYYAKGIGLIRQKDSTSFQDIKNWMVN